MKALTGKAFKAFKAYIKKENGWTNKDFNNHYNCQGYNKYTLADIIEWLDSVGIYVENTYSISYDNSIAFHAKVNMGYVSHDDKSKPINIFDTRQQATEKAIIKAVEIYNNRGN